MRLERSHRSRDHHGKARDPSCHAVVPTRRFAVALILGIFAFSPVSALRDLPSLCETAAETAAQETGIPGPVLRAITLTESGRRANGQMRPWPWTVNMEGTGKWFDTRDAALGFIQDQIDRGARSFDVGCFQINHRWHGAAFSSVDEMFDPLTNARYAARFLKSLFDETQDWSIAAGAYHSRTKVYADRYRKRFEQFRVALATGGPAATPVVAPSAPPTAPRLNAYPLLKASTGPGRMGSLVPVQDRTTSRSPLLNW